MRALNLSSSLFMVSISHSLVGIDNRVPSLGDAALGCGALLALSSPRSGGLL